MLRAAILVVVGLRVLVAVLDADILDSIAGVFNSIIQIPGSVVRAIYQAVKAVYDFFHRLAELVGGAWDWMVNGVEYLGDRAARLGAAAWDGMKWIVERWVPMAVHWALGKAVAYTIGAIRKLEHLVTGLLRSLERYLLRQIRELASFVQHELRVLFGDIRKIGRWIDKATNLVFGILAHPSRLVAWFLADLLIPLIKFIAQHSAPIIRWLVGALGHLLPEFATSIEDALSRLL